MDTHKIGVSDYGDVPYSLHTKSWQMFLRTMHAQGLLLERNGKYMPDLNGITSTIKQKIVETVVYEKYGEVGCRIFSLLLKKGQLEEGSVRMM